MVLTNASKTYHHAYGKYFNWFVILSIDQRERKYLPAAITIVEETMIPVDRLTTTEPTGKNNARYEMIVNR